MGKYYDKEDFDKIEEFSKLLDNKVPYIKSPHSKEELIQIENISLFQKILMLLMLDDSKADVQVLLLVKDMDENVKSALKTFLHNKIMYDPELEDEEKQSILDNALSKIETKSISSIANVLKRKYSL